MSDSSLFMLCKQRLSSLLLPLYWNNCIHLFIYSLEFQEFSPNFDKIVLFQCLWLKVTLEWNHVMRRGACKPCTLSMEGQCVAPGGPQSCKPRELAKRCVSRWAMLKPPLPSNWVRTMITCLWRETKWSKMLLFFAWRDEKRELIPL